MLACCDSRVNPSTVLQMPLGRMFVHRNIANQVSVEDASFTASLCYALKHLGIKKVIIKGHTKCGGISAAREGMKGPGLSQWLYAIRSGIPPEEWENQERNLDDLSRINVLKQMENLYKHPVFQAYGQGVEVIGSLFHLESGYLERLTLPDPSLETKKEKE